MQSRRFKFSVLVLSFLLLGSFISTPVFAHGCLTNEPDRDEDGVPDKDDSAPDDPTLGGLAEKYCGAEPLTMKLFFIPFSSDISTPITKDSIEGRKADAIWCCSKNAAAESVLATLNKALSDTSSMAEVAAGKMSPNHIRLKLATVRSGTDDKVFYVDKFGLASHDGKSFYLNPEQMSQIEASVKQVGCGVDTTTHCNPAESS